MATHDLKLGYIAVEAGLACLMILVLLTDHARGSTQRSLQVAGGQWRSLPATGACYWIAMLTAGTLGTVLGDWVADELGLGVGLGSVVLVAILGIVLLIATRYGRMTKLWYWLGIVAARTAGTTLGDFLASRHGLDLGLPFSTLCTSLLLIAILVTWKSGGATRLREAEY